MDSAPRTYTLALLPGDGIGPEVTAEAARVLDAAADAHGFSIQTSEHAVGGAGLDAENDPLPRATLDACLDADAVFLGAVGGPDWDGYAADLRPERGLLRLRARLGAFGPRWDALGVSYFRSPEVDWTLGGVE